MAVIWDLDAADGCIAVARGDGTLELWDDDRLVCSRALQSPLRFVHLRLEGASLQLLAGDEAGRLWRGRAPRDQPDRLALEALQLDNLAVMCGDVLDGRLYVGCESGSVIEVTDQGLRILAPFGSSILSLCADGDRLWFGTADGFVRALDRRLSLVEEFQVRAWLPMIWDLAPGPRGLAIAAGSAVVVWDGGEAGRMNAPTRAERCTAVRWIHGRDLAIACGQHVVLHDGRSRAILASEHHGAPIQALTLVGRTIYTGCEDGELARWGAGETAEVLVPGGDLPEEPDPTDDVDLTGLWIDEAELTDEQPRVAPAPELADDLTEDFETAPIEIPPVREPPPPDPEPPPPDPEPAPTASPEPAPMASPEPAPTARPRPVRTVPEPAPSAPLPRFRDGVPAAPPPPPPSKKGG